MLETFICSFEGDHFCFYLALDGQIIFILVLVPVLVHKKPIVFILILIQENNTAVQRGCPWKTCWIGFEEDV